MAKGYIVPHTHWDREWRYPLWHSTEKLVTMMDELLEILSTQPDYKSFMLDGQIIPLVDYLSCRPEKEEEAVRLVKEGRILIGPWYTLPDLFPVSGESIVRNLIKGREAAKKFGRILGVAYESFGWGQPSQFPQIYAGFGMDTVIVAKKVDPARAPDCEFIWVGKDGTEMLATRLGNEARANFFMHTYMEAMNGKPYKDDGFRLRYGDGDLVFHRADMENCEQDYCKLTRSQRVHKENLRALALDAWNAMEDTLLGEDRVLMDGSDATTAQPQILELIDAINPLIKEDGIEFEMSSIEEYARILKEKLDPKKLKRVYGELRDGPPQALTGNALMTRPYIKQLNRRAQARLFDIAEPLSFLAAQLGGAYNSRYLKKALEYMLLAHSHDSINGVTQDKTAQDVVWRLNQALEIADVITDECLKTILKNLDMDGFAEDDILVMVMNPLPFPNREVVRCAIDIPREKEIWDFALRDTEGKDACLQRISRDETVLPVTSLHSRPEPFYADRHVVLFDTGELPPGGYKIFKVVPVSCMSRKIEAWAEPRKTRGKEIAVSAGVLENEYLKAEVAADGTVGVLDKKSGNVFKGLNRFESTGDVGDYWIYYPPYNNCTLSSACGSVKVGLVENTELAATIRVQIKMEVPAFANRPRHYVQGKSERALEQTVVPIEVCYSLRAKEDFLRVNVKIKNTAEDHRMSVWFPTGIAAKKVLADGHFCVDGRDALPGKDESGRYYPEMATNPMQTFVSVSTEGRGFAVISSSIGEYDAARREELGLTLFRAVPNRICTEFRSFSEYGSQKGGQCLRELVYEYAILPHNGNTQEILRKARAFNVQCLPVQFSVCTKTKGALRAIQSFYEVQGACVSALKESEDGAGWILRLYNPADSKKTATLKFAKPLQNVWLTDMAEQKQRKIRPKEGEVKIEMAPYKISTLFFQF